ncbi:MAG TPA: TIGR02611 family protein [Dermatophilaceae bacterium]
MNRRPHRRGGDPEAAQDHNITLDAADDDWEWRRKIRSNPHSHLIYRILVGLVGLAIVALGLILVPFPGPGWVIVFVGLAVWASEFEWAQRLLHRAKNTLKTWNDLVKVQPWWVKGLVLLLTIAAVAAIFWLLFLISGVPGYFPDIVETWLRRVPGLG